MEPMTLGSPSGSPAYLPSFLLGDPQASPDKSRTGENKIQMGNSPLDFNRSAMNQKVLFRYEQTPPTPARQNNPCGPPTTGLFDSLKRNDLNQLTTPKRENAMPQCSSQMGTPIHGRYQSNQQQLQNTSTFGMNHSQYDYSNTSFNASRSVLSPMSGGTATQIQNQSQQFGGLTSFGNTLNNNNFWITVFGFPPSSSNAILQHFTNCGTIVDKIFAAQNGNWMHIKFSAQSECARALNYNEKILFNNIMIGVTQCHEKSILEKENINESMSSQTCRARPLTQSVYKPTQVDAVSSPVSNVRTTGIVNKAMELLFNW